MDLQLQHVVVQSAWTYYILWFRHLEGLRVAAIKPIDQSSDKWQRRAQVAGPDYQAGVENPRRPWAEAAAGADQSYRQAVTEAASQGRYSAGVRRAGDARWREGAVSKGPSRFAEGVSLAVGRWQAGYGPYQAAISRVQLPPRGPAGSPQNLQRVTTVAQTLRAVKTGTGGGTTR